MKHFILILLLMVSVNAFAQSDFDKLTDSETNTAMFFGAITFGDLEKEADFSWFKKGAEGYKPDAAAIGKLRELLPEYQVVVVMGTWCEDSHNLVPKLYKTLQAIGYPMQQVSMYAVNRAKEGKNYEHKTYKVDRVPTIIVYQHNMEVGRITEAVKESVEADILHMVEKK